MKIRVILKFFLISFLFFSSFSSFSQTKPILQIFDSTKVCDGYILWMSKSRSQLMDRRGNALFNFPGNYVSFFNNKKEIASHAGSEIVGYNKNFDMLWRFNSYTHHELMTTSNNNVMALASETHQINNVSLRFDNILCLDSNGKKLYNWSIYDQRKYMLSFIMKDKRIFHDKIKGCSEPDTVLLKMVSRLFFVKEFSTLDLFHINAIQEIPENESGKKDSAFRKGNILLSFCNYSNSISSFIAIIDPVQFKILWYYVIEGNRPIHTPNILPNGHILVYVNSRHGQCSSFIY